MAITYLVTNKINGKQYCGYTKWTLENRKKQHEKATLKGHNSKFYNALRKYGPDNFEWKIIFEGTIEEAKQKEIETIAGLNLIKNSYNVAKGGNGGATHEMLMKAIETKRDSGVMRRVVAAMHEANRKRVYLPEQFAKTVQTKRNQNIYEVAARKAVQTRRDNGTIGNSGKIGGKITGAANLKKEKPLLRVWLRNVKLLELRKNTD